MALNPRPRIVRRSAKLVTASAWVKFASGALSPGTAAYPPVTKDLGRSCHRAPQRNAWLFAHLVGLDKKQW